MRRITKADPVEPPIWLIRGHHVILDGDLAGLYGVPTKALNKAVSRNMGRFPPDFMFRLTKTEGEILRGRDGALGWGTYAKYLPRAFTEEGIAMLSGLLRAERAVQVNIAIMRAFVRWRRLLAGDRGLGALVAEHENRLDGHDQEIAAIIEAIPQLPPPEPAPESRPVIGFTPPPEGQRHVERKRESHPAR